MGCSIGSAEIMFELDGWLLPWVEDTEGDGTTITHRLVVGGRGVDEKVFTGDELDLMGEPVGVA